MKPEADEMANTEGTKTFMAKIRASLAKFRDDQEGTSFIEFALVMPILLVIFLPGSLEVTTALLVKRKASQTATVLSDLATQSPTINATAWSGMSSMVSKIMHPYGSFSTKLRVIGVEIDKNKKIKVKWSYGTAPLDTSTLPKSLIVKNSFYVMSAAEVTYKPMFASNVVGNIQFRDTAVMVPRVSSTIENK